MLYQLISVNIPMSTKDLFDRGFTNMDLVRLESDGKIRSEKVGKDTIWFPHDSSPQESLRLLSVISGWVDQNTLSCSESFLRQWERDGFVESKVRGDKVCWRIRI
jgi:hypothetical protein